MASDKVRVGIIGANARYGWSMRAHLPALLALPNYELTAVCTSQKETAEESAKHYGAKLAFHDFREMVQHPEVDLVTVSVRVPLHHSMVMAAAESGKHVFCEWPLGANLTEAEEMASLAGAKGVKHMVGLQARGSPALLRIKELLSEGYLGEILSCHMSMFLPGLLQRGLDRAWMADSENGANTLSIATGHSIDALCFCVGEFRDLSARVTTQVPVWQTGDPGKTVDVTAADNVVISGTLENGASVSAHVATVPWYGTGWRMEVFGREGTLVASSEEMVQYGNVQLLGGRGDAAALERLPVPDNLTRVSGETPQGEPFNVAQMYQELLASIQHGTDVQADFDLAVKRHRLLDSVQRSSAQGGKVVVP